MLILYFFSRRELKLEYLYVSNGVVFYLKVRTEGKITIEKVGKLLSRVVFAFYLLFLTRGNAQQNNARNMLCKKMGCRFFPASIEF